MSPHDELLDRGRELLRAARASRGTWTALLPKVEASGAGDVDLRERDRRQLAWALQYDRRDDDAELVRTLLEYEVGWREVAPRSGVGETMEILGWLVAQARRVEDVWLLARVKWATFETSYAFDREHLLCAGVAETIAFVRASTHVDRDRLLKVLRTDDGRPVVSDEQVMAWAETRARAFPRVAEAEPLVRWLERALDVGAHGPARELLARWSSCAEHDVDDVRALARYHHQLGNHRDEAQARLTLLGMLGDRKERAEELGRTAGAERRAQRWTHALEHLEQAGMMHRVRPAWRELEMGRELVRESFELAASAAASSAEVARRAFALGCELASATPELPRDTLLHGERAASALGDTAQQELFAQRAATRRTEG
jgi:hypothetical protein